MILDTYDDLKLRIAQYLHRDDLAEMIPLFIRLAESRHRKEIRCDGNEGRWRTSTALPGINSITGAQNPPSRYLGRPEDYIGFRMVRIIEADSEAVVAAPKITSPEGITNKIRRGYGLPSWYSIHQDLEFDIIPTPDAYRVEVLYFRAFKNLSVDTPTNWLLTNAPDLYLYGSLLDSAPYIRPPREEIAFWKITYEEKRDELVSQYENQAYSMGSIEGTPLRTVI